MIIKLIILTLASILYYTVAANRDVIASRAKGEPGDSAKWHKYEFQKILIWTLLAAYLYSAISLQSLYVIGVIATLRIVYFNPMIATKLGSTFFHLGQGTWEKRFEGKEKLYYFTNLALLIICYCLIILKIY